MGSRFGYLPTTDWCICLLNIETCRCRNFNAVISSKLINNIGLPVAEQVGHASVFKPHSMC